MELIKAKKIEGKHCYRILVIDLEPTPYKTDLWNTFSESAEVELFVIYTERKNWSPDGGHNYLVWPKNKHKNIVLEGKGIYGSLLAAFCVIRKIFKTKTDLIHIAGYAHFSTIVAIICSIMLKKKFVVHADEFNNKAPQGTLVYIRKNVRELLRKLIFKYGDGVLVCGRRGIESAVLAGCNEKKILNFPYVIDIERIKTDTPDRIPHACIEDMAEGKTIVFFSGRMIPRKGLPTLLSALSNKLVDKKWTLWIEGDGPELEQYKLLAQKNGMQERCKFLGFCQYDLHSWLIRSSDIVVVPSLMDTWGIVVDEGIQLGKTVISSDATGSGYDRIFHGQNGFIFPAGDVAALAHLLDRLINNYSERELIPISTLTGSRNFRPTDNLEVVLKLIKK